MELIDAKLFNFVKDLVVVFGSSLIACKKYTYVHGYLLSESCELSVSFSVGRNY